MGAVEVGPHGQHIAAGNDRKRLALPDRITFDHQRPHDHAGKRCGHRHARVGGRLDHRRNDGDGRFNRGDGGHKADTELRGLFAINRQYARRRFPGFSGLEAGLRGRAGSGKPPDTKHQHNDGNAGKEIVPLRHGLRLVRETDETLTRPKCDQAPGKCNDNSRATGSVVSSPPCAAMIRSTIVRPSPAPLVLAWSARLCPRTSSRSRSVDRPSPPSPTAITGSGPTLMVTVLPVGVTRTAFSMWFRQAAAIASRRPRATGYPPTASYRNGT